MYSFTWSHLNSVKRSWETGHLRGVGIFSWGSAFTGSGRKIGWRIVLTIWFFCYAKNGVGNQIVVGDFPGRGNNWILWILWGPQSSSRENPDMHIENHNLFFYYKTFWVYIKNNKKYLVLNIWKYSIEHKFQKKYFCEQFSENLSVMV